MSWSLLALLMLGCGGDDPVDTDPVDTDPVDTDTDTYTPPPPDLEIDVPLTFDFSHVAGLTYCPQFISTLRFTNNTTEDGTFIADCPELNPGAFRPISFARQETTDYVPHLELAIPAESTLTVNVVFNCTIMTTFEHEITLQAAAGDVDYAETFEFFADVPTNPGG